MPNKSIVCPRFIKNAINYKKGCRIQIQIRRTSVREAYIHTSRTDFGERNRKINRMENRAAVSPKTGKLRDAVTPVPPFRFRSALNRAVRLKLP